MESIESFMAPQIEQSRSRRSFGLATGIVRRIDEDGGYRVEYLGMGSTQPSAPARVMVPTAGNNRGFHCLPDVGDEVVVAFHEGDTSYPIILGALWNALSPPPGRAKPSPENNVRTFVSRSGHELTFDDTPGAESVTLRSKGGHTLTLSDAPGAGGITLESRGGRSLEIDETPPGSIRLSSAAGATIEFSDAGGTLRISAPASITLQSASISLEAAAVTISAPPAMVAIGNIPFALHTHMAPAPPTPPVAFTGPVLPV